LRKDADGHVNAKCDEAVPARLRHVFGLYLEHTQLCEVQKQHGIQAAAVQTDACEGRQIAKPWGCAGVANNT
jgi:hypothetical protein